MIELLAIVSVAAIAAGVAFVIGVVVGMLAILIPIVGGLDLERPGD